MEKNLADTTDSPQSLSQDTAVPDGVAPFWSQYVEEAGKYDDALIEKNKIRVDGVLFYAGLFSAVTASFLVSLQDTLQPNPSDTTNALLMMIVHSLNNSTFSGQSLGIPTWNGPAYSSVLAQALGYAALSISLLAALGAILGKQWLGDYAASKIGSLQERGSKRQQRLDALEKWRFEVFMETLPALIQLALLLFGVALSIALWEKNKTVGYVVIFMTGLGVSFYLIVTVASLLYPRCPFRTPLSSSIQEATAIVAKSVEEIADHWVWSSATIPQMQEEPVTNQVNKALAHLATLLFLLATAWIIPIVVSVLFCCVFVLAIRIRNGQVFRTRMAVYRLRYLRTVKERFYNSACVIRNYARRAGDFIRLTCQDPVPDLDHATFRAVAWLLRTSTHPEKLIAALKLAPVVAWPKDSNLSLLGEGPHNLFARSILEIHSLKVRALPLGQALVVLLCRIPLSVRSYGYIREETVEQLDKIIREQIADWDFDVVFTLTIVQKLLRLRLGLGVHESELSPTRDVSQSLLVWLLGLMETMLRLGPLHAKEFLPEASRLYRKLDLKRANLSPEQQVQYCRTFEIFFNFKLGEKVEEMDVSGGLPEIRKQSDCLERILAKLKSVNLDRLPDIQGHLTVTLTVLSNLATTPSLREIIKDAALDSWMLEAFREAIGRADRDERSVWLFVGCLVQLAADVDAFNLTQRTGPSGLFARVFGRGKPGPSPPCMDSKSLLSYLLNKQTRATSEQIIYALRIMLSNEDEHLVLASDPHFVDYILVATDPSGEDSIRDVGLKVLAATCQSLLHAHDAKSLVALANNCDLARFVHRAILHQDQPTILSDLLRINNKDFNEKLFENLALELGDPFEVALTQLREEPNKIPEHDLRDLETALVLSDNEGKKKYLFNYLDDHIATMSLSDSRSTMSLPLTVIIGWLFRRGGPICSSGKIDWKAFLRPKFQRLLFSAWGDPYALGDDPQTLQLLLNCTEKWLSTYGYFSTEVSSQSPPAPTLERLQRAVDQLSSGDSMLPLDIQKTLRRFSIEFERHGKKMEGSGSGAVGRIGSMTQTRSL